MGYTPVLPPLSGTLRGQRDAYGLGMPVVYTQRGAGCWLEVIMHLVITEERHDRVSWEVHSPIVWLELGLLAGALLFTPLVLASPHPSRWTIASIMYGILGLIGVIAAVAIPLRDHGYLERRPEGGKVHRGRVWVLVGERRPLDVPLEAVLGIELEPRLFEDVSVGPYTLARLWLLDRDQERRLFTGWVELAEAQELMRALNRAGRWDL